MDRGRTQRGEAALRALRPQIRDPRMENIAGLAHRARELGDVIPPWYGEGDMMVTPAYIRDAAKAALGEGLTFDIPDTRGHRPLFEALSDCQSGLHGIPFGLDRSTVTPGGMQAVHLAMTAIAEAGRNVVCREPQWPNIANAIHVSGAEPRVVPMDYRDGRWVLDLDRLFRRLRRAHPRHRLVLALQSAGLGGARGRDPRAAGVLPPPRHLDHRR